MYGIQFARDVKKDLKGVPTGHHARLLDAIETQLLHEPTRPTRNRKLLVNLIPPWPAEPPIWELRVGNYRIFYDVAEAEAMVYVRAIRRKPAGKTTEDIL